MRPLPDDRSPGDSDHDREGHEEHPTRAPISTVGALITALSAYPSQTAVRLALQPGYPLAVELGVVACTPDDVDDRADARSRWGDPAAHEQVVWISDPIPRLVVLRRR